MKLFLNDWRGGGGLNRGLQQQKSCGGTPFIKIEDAMTETVKGYFSVS